MKICIVGSNGQLGSEFFFLKNMDNRWTFLPFDKLNIINRKKLLIFFRQNKFNFLINCSAYTAVDKAEDDKEGAFAVNEFGVKNLVDGCKIHDTKLIHISTDYVFDGVNPNGYDENSITNPLSIYGKSKRSGEIVIENSKIKSIIIRTSWLYSTFGNNFVKTMLRLSKNNKSVGVVADQFGSPTYARDLANGIIKILEDKDYKWKTGGEIFHYSNSGYCSWYEFAKKIFELKNIKIKVNKLVSEEFKTKAKRPKFSILINNKFKSTFNTQINSWEEALKSMLNEQI